MIRNWQRLRRLFLLLRAAGWLITFRVMIHRRPMRWILVRFLEASIGEVEEDLPDPQSTQSQQVAWAVSTAARYLPGDFVCLPRALTAMKLLHSLGIASTIHFGAKTQDQQLKAHAWLSCGGRILTGVTGSRVHSSIAAFSTLNKKRTKAAPSLYLRASVAGISLVFSACFSEALLRFGEPISRQQIYQRRSSSDPEFQFFLNMARLIDKSLPAVPSDALLPLAGPANNKLWLCRECGQEVSVQTDEHGFNKPPGLHRENGAPTALIGDSFTHGFCVLQGEDISSRMTDLLGKPVINLGYSGHGPLSEFAVLAEYASEIRPQRVYWMFYEGNDWSDLEFELGFTPLAPYAHGGYTQGLRERQSEVDRFLRSSQNAYVTYLNHKPEPGRIGSFLRFEKLRQLIHRVRGKSLSGRQVNPGGARVKQELRRLLERAKTLTESWGGSFKLVYLPAPWRYASNASSSWERSRKILVGIAADLGIDMIDIHQEVFLNGRSDYERYFPGCDRFSHYNAAGYAAIARILSRDAGNQRPQHASTSKKIQNEDN